MNNGWEVGKDWSDKFLPEIKRILGEQLIAEPPIVEDMTHNTDLIVLNMAPVRIACRVRRYKYFQQYPDDITIRATLPNGGKTELTKIIEGWGDYFFYGFSDESEKQLIAWKLCKLNAFRIWFNRKICHDKGTIPGICKDNTDNSSSFRAFRATEIPDFVVAEKNIKIQEAA
jgi:hypothetical protein